MLYDVKERFKLAGLCVPYPKEWNLSTLEEKSMVMRLLDDGYCDVDEREVVSLNSLGNELLHEIVVEFTGELYKLVHKEGGKCQLDWLVNEMCSQYLYDEEIDEEDVKNLIKDLVFISNRLGYVAQCRGIWVEMHIV